MFLNMRLKSSNPQTRMKAIREMVGKISAEQGRPQAFDWLTEQAHNEQDPEVLELLLNQIDEARRLIAIASDEAQGDMLEQWGLDEIHADLQRCGFAGSPTKVFRIQSIVLTKEGFASVEPTEEGIRGLVHELIEDRTLG